VRVSCTTAAIVIRRTEVRRFRCQDQTSTKNYRMPPPSQLEIVVIWITGIVVTILSGGVAIYASHFFGDEGRVMSCAL
jgi:hypothetical protein